MDRIHTIEAGRTYRFRKSGSPVKAVAPSTPYLGQPCWTVERTDGESVGKQITVPEDALDPMPDEDMSNDVYEILRSAVNISRSRGVQTASTLRMHLAHYYPGKEKQIDEALQFWADSIAAKGRPSRY